ncbi:DUF4747 family protein [Leptospirillum ferrooxidans]|uniref:Uncharacterized protein n=1 Tax=Leptospirillum ferrooxidans (strain C2-3) TaxID=1162668 RepID=I0IM42_LEPFC|nr:DUF4747 family protein [Leptospirillum ferrooxidans]BAM06341.1 hypothetical protein LFE_0625 [Leptospirillum ferrooxidans C2-3]
MRKAKDRNISISIINIAVSPPHEASRYVQLMQDALELKNPVNLKGDWVGMIGVIAAEEERTENSVRFLCGKFYKYIDLISTKKWFNIKEFKPAQKNEIESIQIPDELKPHFQESFFVFLIEHHRLFFITKNGQNSFSPFQANKVLSSVFSRPEILTKYENVSITVEPARESLDNILTLPQLHTLKIEITPPNPDDLGEDEKEIFGRMHDQNARSYSVELSAATKNGLIPDEKTRKIAKVAQSNGMVTGIGGEYGNTNTLSTSQHPYYAKTSFNPEHENIFNVLVKKAIDIWSNINSKE